MANHAHARRLGFFAWIYALLLAAATIFGFLSFYYVYGPLLGGGDIPNLEELNKSLEGPYSFHVGLGLAFLAFTILSYLLLLLTIVLNLVLGLRLRSEKVPTGRFIVVTSIFNLISGAIAGLIVMPFGVAIFIYGLWFAINRQRITDGVG